MDGAATSQPQGDLRLLCGTRVLVVGGGPFQLDIIRAARRLGLEVVVVDRSPSAPGMALAHHALAIDTAQVAEVVAAARRLQVTGVVTAASDIAVTAVAAVAEEFGMPGLRSDVARRCRDKLATFERMHAAKLPVPRTINVRTVDEAVRAARGLSAYPVVVKPRSSAGGRGVTIVGSADQLAGALARALGYAGAGDGALVQEHIGGISVGVEAFFWQGRLAQAFVLSDQYVDGFVSPIGHALPSALDEATQRAIIDGVARFGAAVGICDGPANFDLRFANGETVLIEINARLGGNSITELVRSCYGVDLSLATVVAALGRAPGNLLARTRLQPGATRLVLAPRGGRARVRPGAPWRDRPGVVSVELTVGAGELAPAIDDWSLLGRCVVTAASAEAAIARASELAAEVGAGIELEPELGR
jgi:biotin carboxylase